MKTLSLCLPCLAGSHGSCTKGASMRSPMVRPLSTATMAVKVRVWPEVAAAAANTWQLSWVSMVWKIWLASPALPPDWLPKNAALLPNAYTFMQERSFVYSRTDGQLCPSLARFSASSSLIVSSSALMWDIVSSINTTRWTFLNIEPKTTTKNEMLKENMNLHEVRSRGIL